MHHPIVLSGENSFVSTIGYYYDYNKYCIVQMFEDAMPSHLGLSQWRAYSFSSLFILDVET